MTDHGCNTGTIFRTKDIGADTRGLDKNNLRIRTLEKRWFRKKESLGKYREERKQVVKR